MKVARVKGDRIAIQGLPFEYYQDSDRLFSPAVALINLMQRYNHERRCSEMRHAIAVRSAIYLAIRQQMRFDLDDFKNHGLMQWGYIEGGTDGGLYKVACEAGNLTACKSIERCLERKPFILNGRIYVGRQFEWQRRLVRCTSIAKDGQSLIAVPEKVTVEVDLKALNIPPAYRMEERSQFTWQGCICEAYHIQGDKIWAWQTPRREIIRISLSEINEAEKKRIASICPGSVNGTKIRIGRRLIWQGKTLRCQKIDNEERVVVAKDEHNQPYATYTFGFDEIRAHEKSRLAEKRSERKG